jgi:hypothetical protein
MNFELASVQTFSIQIFGDFGNKPKPRILWNSLMFEI